MVQSNFRSEVVVKTVDHGRALVDPEFAGLRKLAAEVIKHAIYDYHASKRAMVEARRYPYLYDAEYLDLHRRTVLETKGFLTDDTLFHQILDLDPLYFQRLINEGTLPEVEWRADKRIDR